MRALDDLREDLWDRWREQVERFPQALQQSSEARDVIYGSGPLFDLKKYTPGRFKPEGRRSPNPLPDRQNWLYRLDAGGMPVRMETRHPYNRIDWQGRFDYAPGEAEYSEWCLQTGVCSQHDRITFDAAQPQTFQRLRINTAGSAPIWRGLAPKKLVDRIRSDSHNYHIWVEAYEGRDGLVESGVVYTEGLGGPPTTSTLAYSYADGKLQSIVQRGPAGEEHIVFAARQAATGAQLARELSERIAGRALELLAGARFESPLVALELSYQAVESYVPVLIPCLEGDTIETLTLAAEIDPGRWIHLREEEFAPAITDFHQRVRRTEKYDAGSRMLREAARLIAEQARTRLRVSDAFVAYAIDWEMEGEDLDEILRDCGASPASIRELRSRGWI